MSQPCSCPTGRLVGLDFHKSLLTPGSELHFPSVQPSDAGVYICTCRNLIHTSNSRAELLVAGESPASLSLLEPA